MQYNHQQIPVGDLRPNPWNTNVMSAENETKLDESIRRFGLYKPVIVRETAEGLQILGGQHRWESAIRLGMEDVPVVNVGPIDDITAKELGLVDNGRYGVDDADQLSSLLRDLGHTSDLASFLPYSEKELEVIFKTEPLDIDELDLDGSDEVDLAPAPESTGPTHQIMRFKVPVEDAEWVSLRIEQVAKANGMTSSDSLTNAGDALVHLLRSGASE